ncbi:calmodulin-binding receptor kinase CaMRLK-like [Dioscorea cayenensis subsp. rotundata]|uniref:Calmodulin-binding receptor kinase CaMRLK-like n=1 Tax=Dioscorea cayennensis subsp. rotundata TaxID=55577 RepID=A0AB40CU46_DIOCR|nr:calmodulin-binding receptor kinase CaMRLK-like [Dioscorea cayenensis subsp. rotundata]
MFGSSSFKQAGSLITFSPPPPPPPPQNKNNNHKNNKKHKISYKIVAISATSAILLLFTLLTITIFSLRRRRRTRRRRKGDEIDEEKAVEQCATWVAEAKWSSPVIIFEKPLMELTFADLATATSCFSKDSQLADGHRCGPLYRAVLTGDMHVVIRVLKNGANCDAEELSQLRHPNLLPLLGYCLAGKEKLFLYEYMEKGDMRRWLNELPAARSGEEEETLELCDWPARHKVALGVARGLAFLHQGSRRPVVHGHLVPANVLLDDEMEARIADFGVVGGGEGSVVEDVYGFGLLVLELVTGKGGGWTEKEVERVRTAVRGGRAAEVVDVELRRREECSPEMVEFVRVGYLCTAQCQMKRPTMQQVVGLLKDIRPTC